MELNEACEKAARYWLGWVWDADNCWWIDREKKMIYFPRKDCAAEFIDRNNIVHLASPWGRDLLLRAAEERGYEWDAGLVGGAYDFWLKGQRSYGYYMGKSEYEAVVFAFARVVDELTEIENYGEPR